MHFPREHTPLPLQSFGHGSASSLSFRTAGADASLALFFDPDGPLKSSSAASPPPLSPKKPSNSASVESLAFVLVVSVARLAPGNAS